MSTILPSALMSVLTKNIIDYKILDSKVLPTATGTIIVFRNYNREEDQGINISIALSLEREAWGHKCWLSLNLNTNNDFTKPRPFLAYGKFLCCGINYYPYSVNTSAYQLVNVLCLCDHLCNFVEYSQGK